VTAVAKADDRQQSGPSVGPLSIWTVPSPERLLWHDLGAVAVVFNARSGDTHVVDPLAHEALALLVESPRTASALTAALADLLEAPEAEVGPKVEAILTEFDRLGLIFPLVTVH
jgi:PqqD family protein of HPr-rel-A system